MQKHQFSFNWAAELTGPSNNMYSIPPKAVGLFKAKQSTVLYTGESNGDFGSEELQT